MGLSIGFSRSSYDCPAPAKPLPNPNPMNYSILKHEQIGRFLLLKVRYHDCTNYEGEKILLFENCTFPQIQKQKKIDPHFSENKNYHSPVVRFAPTERGEFMAQLLCHTMQEVA